MENKKRIALGILALISCVALATGILGTALSQIQSSRVIPNSGSVKGVGVEIYQYSNATGPVTSFSWGTLDPGTTVSKTVYIMNKGNAPATLSMAASNWNPSGASSYMTLSWNYAGQTLAVNQVLQVRFTLTVSSSTTGISNFSFDITVTATG